MRIFAKAFIWTIIVFVSIWPIIGGLMMNSLNFMANIWYMIIGNNIKDIGFSVLSNEFWKFIYMIGIIPALISGILVGLRASGTFWYILMVGAGIGVVFAALFDRTIFFWRLIPVCIVSTIVSWLVATFLGRRLGILHRG